MVRLSVLTMCDTQDKIFDSIKLGDLVNVEDPEDEYIGIYDGPFGEPGVEYIPSYPGISILVLRKGTQVGSRAVYFYIGGLLCDGDGLLRLCWLRLRTEKMKT